MKSILLLIFTFSVSQSWLMPFVNAADEPTGGLSLAMDVEIMSAQTVELDDGSYLRVVYKDFSGSADLTLEHYTKTNEGIGGEILSVIKLVPGNGPDEQTKLGNVDVNGSYVTFIKEGRLCAYKVDTSLRGLLSKDVLCSIISTREPFNSPSNFSVNSNGQR